MSGLSEGRSSANKIELSLSKTVQIVFGQAAVAKQVREHEWKNGIAIVIPSVNLPPMLRQFGCLRDRPAVGYTKVRMHMRVETRSDPIGRRLDAFIAEIDFGLPPMMRHMNVQG